MRTLEDPIVRNQALMLYRTGYDHKDMAKALDLSVATVRKEMDLDPEWAVEVKHAMAFAFEPVLQRAIDLALKADAEGFNEGSLKAMDMVMKFYGKALDREHATELVEKKIAAEASLNQAGNRPPMLTTPEAVEAFMHQLTTGEVVDAEVVEDSDDQ